MQFSILIPEKVSLNKVYGGIHYRVRKALADLYHKEFMGHQRYEGEYPIQIIYKFIFKRSPLDSTNTALMAKMLEDSMVLNRVIAADDWKTVKRTILESEKGDLDTVEITLLPYGETN